jgi:hypothetical protein
MADLRGRDPLRRRRARRGHPFRVPEGGRRGGEQNEYCGVHRIGSQGSLLVGLTTTFDESPAKVPAAGPFLRESHAARA